MPSDGMPAAERISKTAIRPAPGIAAAPVLAKVAVTLKRMQVIVAGADK